MSTVLVTGANRGIGLEFVRQYAGDGWTVIACCRDTEGEGAAELRAITAEADGSVSIEPMDMLDHGSIEAIAKEYAGTPIDVLLNNAGIIGPVPIQDHLGAQHFGTIDYEVWDKVIRTNTFAPIKMAEEFLGNVLAGTEKKIITLSSTVGSFQEDVTPAFCYCTSKTAVTKAVQLMSEELKDKNVVAMAFCPGHVKTRMGIGGATVEIPDSVAGMRSMIANFSMADTGSYRRFNGDTIAW
ncbi:MAG: SDR family oxidoreductase [Rhodospirillaceae bacterium]|jgi:NAD(P)-dependent dehydrogenase (short-subunit alcohol dehydrogenase family)|nr:SDR family oxidoreductase [Rhodospirillaceae bacterium]